MPQPLTKDTVSFESQDTQHQARSNQYPSSLEDESSQQPLHSLNDLDDGYETSDSDLTDLESIDTPSEFETTGINTPPACSQPNTRGPQRLPTMPHNQQKKRSKLSRVVKALQRNGWGMEAFIDAWIQSPDILTHKRYRTPAKRRNALYSALSKSEAFHGHHHYIALLKQELKHLINTPYFAKFNHGVDLDTIDFQAAFETIRTDAPTWFKLLTPVLKNKRANRKSYEWGSDETTAIKRLFVIMSIICHSYSLKNSNFFSSILSAYFHGSGVKRRVIETISSFGLCLSYVMGNKLMTEIAKQEKMKLRQLVKDPRAVIVYDNMNFKETVRDETIGHNDYMAAVTTAAVVISPAIPESGLTQIMHDSTRLLTLKEIIDAPGVAGNDYGLRKKITLCLISDAVRKVHDEGVKKVFSTADALLPQMPVLDTLPVYRTRFQQLGAIFENEGTIAGTMRVHEKIFNSYLDLSKDHTAFSTRLFPVYGDALTTKLIRSVKIEQSKSTDIFEQRNWLHPVSGWFHIQMNLLSTIVRTHFEAGVSEEARHCIQSDLACWNRNSMTSTNPKYHLLEPMISQSFASRSLALFYAAMQHRGYPIVNHEHSEDIDTIIHQLNPSQYLQLIEDVYTKAFTLDAWTGTDSQTSQSTQDIEFRTMCRLLRESELFIRICYAVKYGDIGLLEYSIPSLIIFFLGAGQHNYATEMLHYYWILQSAKSPSLRRAIMASGLVNWPGKPGSFKAIDLGMEHLNGSCKLEMKCYKNSTKNTYLIFDRVCLSNTWVHQLRRILESTFGRPLTGEHTSAVTKLEIFSMARSLLKDGYTSPRDLLLLPKKRMFDSLDILTIGVENLEKKIEHFNQAWVQQRSVSMNLNFDDIIISAEVEAYSEEFNDNREQESIFIENTLSLSTVNNSPDISEPILEENN
ncbi:hypothetical protein I7I50_04623 [Histoplasma capsulatum G186AR]|uniref:DUF6589 domain-containing protein n=1 Tax=Ajellomyces capsulatus TaxID=5037 RepID=A0A8H7YKF9_AJECA|nr:hypothetical protein I7I52_05532 [Histoplasma capsulatum]QSS75477.1 hypothetical protein I7I50_04623 [Histoplasma capsulatum G186AR]